MKNFCSNYHLKSLIRVPTCYKNPNNILCIDLILTTCPRNFQSSFAVETGLSDFHKMTATVMKASFQKLRQKVVHYRKCKNFCNQSFKDKLVSELSKENFGINSLERFIDICNNVLNKHAP